MHISPPPPSPPCLSPPFAVPTLKAAVALVRKIRYFKAECLSETKFHCTVGHSTTLATAVFFGAHELAGRAQAASAPAPDLPSAAADARQPRSHVPPDWAYDWAAQYAWQDALLGPPAKHVRAEPGAALSAAASSAGAPPPPLISELAAPAPSEWQWCALLFEVPLCCPTGSSVIASHLDADAHGAACRLAFHGRIVEPLASADVHELSRCNLYKVKTKQGVCDRIEDAGDGPHAGVTIVGRSLFKKDTDMSLFIGLRLHTRAGQLGTIVSSFGKGGKFRAHFPSSSIVDADFVEAPPQKPSERSTQCSAETPDSVVAASGVSTASVKRSDDLAPPPIRPGDPIFLRYRKRLFVPHSAETSGGGKPPHRLLQV
jgi:selenocysteine-specific elongation factor